MSMQCGESVDVQYFLPTYKENLEAIRNRVESVLTKFLCGQGEKEVGAYSSSVSKFRRCR